MLPSLAALPCPTGTDSPEAKLPATAAEGTPPLLRLGSNEWTNLLEQLDGEVAACDVPDMCETLRATAKALNAQTPCDDPDFWESMCTERNFVFYTPPGQPEYVPIALTPENPPADATPETRRLRKLDRWRKQYLLFCRVASGAGATRHFIFRGVRETEDERNARHLESLRNLGRTEEVPDKAFEGCMALTLTHLPAGLTTIGHRAFVGCRALALPYLSARLTTVADNAFEDTSRDMQIAKDTWHFLTSLGFSDPVADWEPRRNDEAFWQGQCVLCEYLFHEGYMPIALSPSFGRWHQQCLFFFNVHQNGNRYLTALQGLGRTPTIGWDAFGNCHALALTHLPVGVTTIGEMAFSRCTALALTHLPEGVTTIGDSAFLNCAALALTELPAGVATIGYRAFEGCHALDLSRLPERLTTMGKYAFDDTTAELEELVAEWQPL